MNVSIISHSKLCILLLTSESDSGVNGRPSIEGRGDALPKELAEGEEGVRL